MKKKIKQEIGRELIEEKVLLKGKEVKVYGSFLVVVALKRQDNFNSRMESA